MSRPVHLGVSDDLDCLVEALDPARGGRFLAISAHGAGEAALALAAMGADEVVANDREDPAALAQILELKITAFELFGREDALVVYGLRPASPLRRKALARQLSRALPHNPMTAHVAEGLVRADRVAQFWKGFMLAMRGLGTRAMFHHPDPAVRIAAFRQAVDRRWIAPLVQAIGSRGDLFFPRAEWESSEYARRLARDPLAYLEGLIAEGPATSPLFAPMVLGRDAVLPESILPPHLRTTSYDDLRARAHRVRIDLPLGPFNGAYLSNVVDYLDAGERTSLFHSLKQGLVEGAPLLVYSNESFAKVPVELGFTLDREVTAATAARDRARIYGRVEVYRAHTAIGERLLRVVEA